jgi:Flp pilus assembly protein TadG
MNRRRKRQRGGSALEMALLLPWYFFLFVGTFDWGFYAHALISTEAAARTAVLYTSQSVATAADQADACTLANEEMRIVPNISNSDATTCTSSPLVVAAVQTGVGQSVASPDNLPGSQVTVTYSTLSLIPIPFVLTNKATFNRVVQMRLRCPGC